MSVARERLAAQRIVGSTFRAPAKLVDWMGAVQAQDYGASKWALGLRLAAEATEVEVERAVAEGEILRIHAMRGTWQYVTPRDVRWVLALVAPAVRARIAKRYRDLGLDDATIARSNAALVDALKGGDHLTRGELGAALERAGISTAGQRLPHMLMRAELDGLLCGGARRGKQGTFALLDLCAPNALAPMRRDEARAELARRYFQSRGPATTADFMWWSGLPAADARAAVESIASSLSSEVVDGQICWRAKKARARATGEPSAQLLPAFDEYLVGYHDRHAVLDPEQARRINAGGGMLGPSVVIDGRVVGTWRRVLSAPKDIELELFDALKRGARRVLDAAVTRYSAFLGHEVRWKARA